MVAHGRDLGTPAFDRLVQRCTHDLDGLGRIFMPSRCGMAQSINRPGSSPSASQCPVRVVTSWPRIAISSLAYGTRSGCPSTQLCSVVAIKQLHRARQEDHRP
jgi:hypothetical protein